MIRYLIAPLLSYEQAVQEAEQCCPQILAERYSPNPKVMAERLTAYLLLAKLMGGSLPQLYWDAHGKPHFAEGLVQFSLSHTKTGAAAVIADHPVGIDLQAAVPVKSRLSERVCSVSEQLYLMQDDDALERQLRFARLWTAKEAVAKSIGCGLGRLSPRDILVDWESSTASVGEQRFGLYYPELSLPQTVCCIAKEI